jgi:xyloglucan:xyloglucosyl transferase
MSYFLLGIVTAVIVTATTGAASYADAPQTMSFDEGYSHLFGGGNLMKSPGGRSVRLKLDRYSGN